MAFVVGQLVTFLSFHSTPSPALRQITSRADAHPALPIVDPKESFSACLLVMDDNFRLSEWLAYHYFTLPLRYLVVAVDPASATSPQPIFDHWMQVLNNDLTIITWTDEDFVDPPHALRRSPSDNHKRIYQKHRLRQRAFYYQCTRHLQQQNRSWTVYHDSDEFVVLNADVLPKDSVERLVVDNPRGGYIWQYLNETVSSQPKENLAQVYRNKVCLPIPRRRFSATDLETIEPLHDLVPHSMILSSSSLEQQQPVAKRFETLRWWHRTYADNTSDTIGKSIMDVSKINSSHFEIPENRTVLTYKTGSAHKPLIAACPASIWDPVIHPLAIHHYIGSWEAYQARPGDARQNVTGRARERSRWEAQILGLGQSPNNNNDTAVQTVGFVNHNDAAMRTWLQHFVQYVGVTRATFLLAEAGLLPQ